MTIERGVVVHARTVRRRSTEVIERQLMRLNNLHPSRPRARSTVALSTAATTAMARSTVAISTRASSTVTMSTGARLTAAVAESNFS